MRKKEYVIDSVPEIFSGNSNGILGLFQGGIAEKKILTFSRSSGSYILKGIFGLIYEEKM